MAADFDPFGSNTKRTHKYAKWKPYMVRTMQRHPDMTAAELGELMGLTAESIRQARKRFGRWSKGTDALCVMCDERPVWGTSKAARQLRLCKHCFTVEERRRQEEERERAALRKFRQRTREGAGQGAGVPGE